MPGLPLPVQGPPPHAVASHAPGHGPATRMAPRLAADVASEQSRPHRGRADELVFIPARRRPVLVSFHASNRRHATRPDVQVPPGGEERNQPHGRQPASGTRAWFRLKMSLCFLVSRLRSLISLSLYLSLSL